jgi:DNA-binding CsgD family transcriptional regulator
MRKTGLGVPADIPWGTHCCHFYETERDLLDTMIPYFKAGLETNEFCLWVTYDPLTEAKATRALRRAVPDFDKYVADRRIEVIPGRQWYLKCGTFSLKRVIRGWNEKLEEALARGFAGMRVTGNTAWLKRKDWAHFAEYENTLNEAIAGKRMIVLCSYPVAMSAAAELLDMARAHRFAIARRRGNLEVVEWKTLPTAPDHYGTLTTREREVLPLAAAGHTSLEIAQQLSIGVRTVETHRAHLMRKLGLGNQSELVRYALQRGLLPPEGRKRRTGRVPAHLFP